MAKLKVLEITTATCGICKSLAPMVEKVVSLHGDSVEFEKKEVDWDDPLVKQYNVTSVPFFSFYNSETEQEYSQHRGPISFNVLNQHIVDAKDRIKLENVDF